MPDFPNTPAELLANIPQTTQNPCEAINKAWLAFPVQIYNLYKFMVSTDGNDLTNAFLRKIHDVGDYKFSADANLDDGTSATIWLLCDGSIKAQADFAALYAVIGATFNTGGEGGGNFRLPDMRGKFPLIRSASHAVGTSGGLEDVTLVEATVPPHTHDITIETDTGGADTAQSLAVQGDGTGFQTFTSDSFGGGGSHENMPPYLTLGYCYIKT